MCRERSARDGDELEARHVARLERERLGESGRRLAAAVGAGGQVDAGEQEAAFDERREQRAHHFAEVQAREELLEPARSTAQHSTQS